MTKNEKSSKAMATLASRLLLQPEKATKTDVKRLAASFAFAPAYEAIVREHLDARLPSRGSITGRAVIEGRPPGRPGRAVQAAGPG